MGLVSGAFKFSIATWINAILYFVFLLVGPILLRQAEGLYADFGIFYDASMTLMNLAMLGLDHAYIRFFHNPPKGIKDERSLAGVCLGFSLGSVVALALAVNLAFPRLVTDVFFSGVNINWRIGVYLFANVFLLVLARYFNITYRMQQNTRMYTIQTVLLQFFSRMFFIFGAFFTLSLESLVLTNLAGLGAFVVIFFLLQRRSMLPDKVEAKKGSLGPLFKYGVPLVPTAIFQYFNALVAKVYVKDRMGAVESDVYTFVSYLSLALGIIQTGFATFWSAFIFGNYKTEQQKIIKAHDFLMFLIMALMAALIFLQPLIFWFFGLLNANNALGAPIFGLMLFAPMLLIISETTVYGINIAKKTYFDTIAIAISVGVNFALCLVLIPRLGMAGAAMAGAVSGAAMFLFRTPIAQRFYKTMDSQARTYLSLGVMAVLCCVSYLFASAPAVVMLAAGAAIVYYCVVYRAQLKRCLSLAREILRSIFKRKSGA